MAGSDWDEWVVDAKGDVVDRQIKSLGGVLVSFYKDCVFLGLDTMIYSGELSSRDVCITVKEGPQRGVYAVFGMNGLIIAGCSVYGWEYPPAPCDIETVLWVGVTGESKEYLKQMMEEIRMESN